jgi:hypothetical protein
MEKQIIESVLKSLLKRGLITSSEELIKIITTIYSGYKE